jgi:hypothetical protein
MDNFVATILSIFDNINEKYKNKQYNTEKNINLKIREKQYLLYYIYRIWIKYRTLMEYTNSVTEFQKILISLNIPRHYFKYRVTYPMQNKLINNEKQIDLVILMILKHFNKCYTYFTTTQKPLPEKYNMNTPEGQYKELNNLLNTKNITTIIDNINILQILVPNLSKPSGKGYLWSNSTPYFSNDK